MPERFPSGTGIRLPPRTNDAHPANHPRQSLGQSPPMDPSDGPSFLAMIALVAFVVATVILLFFGIGYGIGRMFL